MRDKSRISRKKALRDLGHLTTPQECKLRTSEPYDFGWCNTHDRTFPLGGTCDHAGLSELDWLQEREQQQRGRAVRAEWDLHQLQGQMIQIEQLAKEGAPSALDQIIKILEDGPGKWPTKEFHNKDRK